MSLCIIVGAKITSLAITAFTLAWTHSVEKTAWEEDWIVAAEGLTLVEARIKGSGAGMEPPEDATFDGRWWRYRPRIPPLPKLILARSGHAGSWSLCAEERCVTPGGPEKEGDEPVELTPCE